VGCEDSLIAAVAPAMSNADRGNEAMDGGRVAGRDAATLGDEL